MKAVYSISKKLLWLLLSAVLLCPLAPADSANAESNKYSTYGSAIASGLMGWYNDQNGLWNSTGWWNSANALEAIIDYSAKSGSDKYVAAIANTFNKNKAGDFLNHYYDDEGWWALAWIKAYDLTNNPEYLQMAKTIFEDMKGAWDETCGGGVWWNKDRRYKNAITNELFLTVAARLHQRTPGDEGEGSYRDWAEKELAWFLNSGMINSDHLINDGLNSQCTNNGDVTWTYNQGVILGGLIEMYKITGDNDHLKLAESIADAAISRLVNADGILKEPCEDNGCGQDGPSFKGIFMRNLNYLYDTTHKQAYRKFVIRNVESMWENRGSVNQIGLKWYVPADGMSAATQHSALDAVNGLVKKEPHGSSALPNLALKGTATGSEPCSTNEGPDKAIDGSVKPNSQFCSSAADAWLQVDLGSHFYITEFVIKHAGAGGKPREWNTRDYNIQISGDGTNWITVKRIAGNTEDVTVHDILAASARYVRLNISDSGSDAAHIYEVEIYGEPSPFGENLALNQPASGSTVCASSEGPEKAFDGTVMNNSKFCSYTQEKWLQVDLGSVHDLSGFVIKHAGAGGEDPGWNAKDFNIEVSEDGINWVTAVDVTGNVSAETVHRISPVSARYVKLNVTNAGKDNVTRIYEVEVYGE